MGFKLYATENTHRIFRENGIRTKLVYKISERKNPNILNMLERKKLDLVINTQSLKHTHAAERDGYIIRRKAIDYNIPLINNIKIAVLFVNAIYNYKISDLEIRSMDEYR
jgi:carbamoyl-phosphate synthase large subunit